jgi:hypothetical protein
MKHLLLGFLFTASAALAQPVPVLHFEPPKGFAGGPGKDAVPYVSKDGDATLDVYPFRRFAGPFPEQFNRTLLREFVAAEAQEARLAGAPQVLSAKVPGAEAVLFARFVEERSGSARYRLRVAVYAAGSVALVDFNAGSPEAFQRNWPALSGLLDSLKVVVPK